MLRAIGIRTFEELIKHIPQEIRAKELGLPEAKSELELSQIIAELAKKNQPTSEQVSFLGGGAYRRFVPQVVNSVVSRSEFATAYTPYQPEVSQGTLQAIYEFQSTVCILTGMDCANASMYDGPTAAAEAALMAARLTDRKKVCLSQSLNSEYSSVVKTYLNAVGLEYAELEAKSGVSDLGKLNLDSTFAACIVQNPNYFGCLEDLEAIAEKAHDQGALLIVVTDPISLGLLKTPGEFGADIVVGDAQSCGNYLSFGGPSAGYLASRKEFVRQLPGRLCGMTQDNKGRRAYTLTLQTREQHIRRAKATSNICTNQALNALAMLVYLCMMGPLGLKQVAEISVRRAHQLAEMLTGIKGVKLAFSQPFFNEFVIQTDMAAEIVLTQLREVGILGGLDISSHVPNGILVAVTEMNDLSHLTLFQEALEKIVAQTNKSSMMALSNTGNKPSACHK